MRGRRVGATPPGLLNKGAEGLAGLGVDLASAWGRVGVRLRSTWRRLAAVLSGRVRSGWAAPRVDLSWLSLANIGASAGAAESASGERRGSPARSDGTGDSGMMAREIQGSFLGAIWGSFRAGLGVILEEVWGSRRGDSMVTVGKAGGCFQCMNV